MDRILRHFLTLMDWFINKKVYDSAMQNRSEYVPIFYHSRLIICSLFFAGLFIMPNVFYEYTQNSPSFSIDFWTLVVPILIFFSTMRFFSRLDKLIFSGSILFSIALVHGVYTAKSITSISSIWGSLIILYSTILVSPRWGTMISLLICAALFFVLFILPVPSTMPSFDRDAALIHEYSMANLIALGLIIANHKVGESYRKKLDLLNEKNLSREISFAASRSLTSLGKMGAGISHQINNPLAIISSLAGRVESDFENNNFTPEQFALHKKRIIGAMARIEKIVDSLTEFTEFIPSERSYIYTNFASLVESTMEDLVSSGRFPFVSSELVLQEDSEFYAYCEATMMRKAVFNLIENAFEHAGLEDRGWVKVSIVKGEDGIDFNVTNSGMRLTDDQFSQVIQPFFSTKSSADTIRTGMGLTLADCIIQIHGGLLSIDPSKNETTFRFSLRSKSEALRS
jgi:signal transduction histidine kinase